jgi:hypothetical protein
MLELNDSLELIGLFVNDVLNIFVESEEICHDT